MSEKKISNIKYFPLTEDFISDVKNLDHEIFEKAEHYSINLLLYITYYGGGILAFDNNQLVGYILYIPHSYFSAISTCSTVNSLTDVLPYRFEDKNHNNVFTIAKLGVKSSHQNHGIGFQLFKLLIHEFENQDMYLQVRKSNINAQRLYKKHGFIFTGILKDYFAALDKDKTESNKKEDGFYMKRLHTKEVSLCTK
jgi:ribosomal protein S18 acetylase RimI-like enzyme